MALRSSDKFRLWFFIIGLLIIIGWPKAEAADSTLSWTPPLLQIKNCTSEPIEGLAGYRIWQLVKEVDDPTIDTYTVTGLPVGEHTFTATAYNEAGEESVLSGAAVKTIAEITVSEVDVYDVLRQDNRYVLLRVGTIPLGTPCDFTQSVNGHNVVPRDLVDWAGTVRPSVVVAKCDG